MVFGTVIIKPLSALLTGHKEMFDKIDPFVKVYFGGDYQKTDVAKNMGANPIWNNEFCFKNVELEKNVIRFEVLDKNLLVNSTLGCCEYALANLLQVQNHFNGGLLLLHKGVSAGTLYVDIQFIGDQGFQQQGFQGVQSTYPSGGIVGQGTQQQYGTQQQQGSQQCTLQKGMQSNYPSGGIVSGGGFGQQGQQMGQQQYGSSLSGLQGTNVPVGSEYTYQGMSNMPMTGGIGEQVYEQPGMGQKLMGDVKDIMHGHMPQGGQSYGTQGISNQGKDIPLSGIMNQGLVGQNLGSGQTLGSTTGQREGLIGRVEQGAEKFLGSKTTGNLPGQQQNYY